MNSRRGTRATLEQVAAAAGVSLATASKVLNERPNIAPATRARVNKAIAELGYTPSTGPRVTVRAPIVSVVFRTLADIYAMRVLEGVITAARAEGFAVIVDTLDVAQDGLVPLSPEWIRHQVNQLVTGVVIVTSELTARQRALFNSLNLPAVHIDPMNPLVDETISVGSTNFTGGVQATQHLIDLGHRRIAFAGGPERSMPARERLQGYLATMAGAGLEVPRELVIMNEHLFTAGLDMAETFLNLADPPTAIFASSDSSALGVLEAARRLGLRVPEDLSVVGFDDTYAAISSSPALTTVRQPIVEMGRVALRTVLQLARGRQPDSPHVQLATQFVLRQSTAAAPTAGSRSASGSGGSTVV